MATRGMYHFKNAENTHRVYVHWDNYPSVAYEMISNALKLAWPLPRFEPDEFACAFIAANKDHEGGYRLVPHDMTNMGQDYDYYISFDGDWFKGGDLIIEFQDCDTNGETIHFKGTLSDMKKYIANKENQEC